MCFMTKKKSGSLQPIMGRLGEALSKVLQDITADVYEAADSGLDKAAEYLKDKLEAATPETTPEATGATRGMWVINFKYKNVRYINNLRLNEKGIPVVNLLEFGSKGKPFMRKTIAENQENIIDIIKKEIKNGK